MTFGLGPDGCIEVYQENKGGNIFSGHWVLFRDLCRPRASKAWALLMHASLSHMPWVQLNGRNVSVALRIDPIHECAQYIASAQPEPGQSQHRFSFRLCLEKDFPLLGLLFAYPR